MNYLVGPAVVLLVACLIVAIMALAGGNWQGVAAQSLAALGLVAVILGWRIERARSRRRGQS